MILALAVLVLAVLAPQELAALRPILTSAPPAVAGPGSPTSSDLEGIRACIDVEPPAPPFPVEELAADTALFWPVGSDIRVKFADGDPSNQARWFNVAAEWEAVANIDFIAAAGPDYDILVSFNPNGGGYYSYVGTSARSIPRGTPTMVLSGLDRQADDEFHRVALHEQGHALGCIHEHQSPAAAIPWNLPVLYAWYAQTQGWGRAEVDQQVIAKYASPTTQFTAWDRDSIMEYPIDAKLVLDPSFAVGWNRDLTATDRAFIAQCYPGRPAVAPPPVAPPPVKPPQPPSPPPIKPAPPRPRPPVKPRPKPTRPKHRDCVCAPPPPVAPPIAPPIAPPTGPPVPPAPWTVPPVAPTGQSDPLAEYVAAYNAALAAALNDPKIMAEYVAAYDAAINDPKTQALLERIRHDLETHFPPPSPRR